MTDTNQKSVEVIVNQALIDEISRLEDELAEARQKRDDVIGRALRAEAELATTTKSAAADADRLARMFPVLQLGSGASALCATLEPHHMIHGIRRAGFELEKETDRSWIYSKVENPSRGRLAWVPKHREYSDYGRAAADVVRDVAEARGWSQAETLLYFLRIADLYEAADKETRETIDYLPPEEGQP